MKFRFIRFNDPQYHEELMLRWEALRKPLGMPPGSESLPEDQKSLHLLAIEGKKVVGCVLFHPEGKESGKLYQMAISEEYRGKGFGRKLLQTLEKALLEKGYRDVYLYSREETIGFYERLGYHKEGSWIDWMGFPHMLMRKCLEQMEQTA